MGKRASGKSVEDCYNAWEIEGRPVLEQQRRDAAKLKTEGAEEDLFRVLISMLYSSSLIYTFSSLRDYAIEHQDEPGWWEFWKDPPVTLKKQELILKDSGTRRSGAISMKDPLKETIPAEDFDEFIKANLDILNKIDDVEVNTTEAGLFNIFDALDEFVASGSELVEFDDVKQAKECVYGITVNRADKRITVVFRGSVTGNKDWSKNFQAWQTTLDTPPFLKENGFDEKIDVHAGFSAYLFANNHAKYQQIVNQLNSLLTTDEFKQEYSIYVSGHSLGGALAQLLSMKLAASKDLLTDRPITAITFASPYPGGRGFNRAYQVLERMGRLRHIRISNERDVVPVVPPILDYTQTGINFHLKKNKKRELGYRNLHLQTMIFWISNSAHRLSSSHWGRILEHKDELSKYTVTGLYANKDLVGDFTA